MEADTSAQTYTDDRGELIIRRPALGVLVFIERGYLAGSRAEAIIKAMDNELKFSPKLTIFVDGEKLDGYDPPIRTMPTDWLKRNAARVTAQHMLVKSQIARMGLSVAGLALGAVLRGYVDRNGFEAALRQELFGWQGALALGIIDPRDRDSGHVLPRRAKRTLSLDLDRPFGDFSVGAGWRAVSSRYDDANNTVQMGGYGLFGLRGQWRATDELAIHFQIARTNGLTDDEIAEVIYHATGYAGFPAAATANRIAGEALSA